jgi:hypothetical protein
MDPVLEPELNLDLVLDRNRKNFKIISLGGRKEFRIGVNRVNS